MCLYVVPIEFYIVRYFHIVLLSFKSSSLFLQDSILETLFNH